LQMLQQVREQMLQVVYVFEQALEIFHSRDKIEEDYSFLLVSGENAKAQVKLSSVEKMCRVFDNTTYEKTAQAFLQKLKGMR